jgi:hypothetical protein
MLKKIWLMTIGLAFSHGLAHAADLVEPPIEPESAWTFTIAPYVWLAGLHGDVAAFGAPEVEVDLSISDVLEHFDIGLMGASELRNGRFSLGTDFLWVKLSAEENTPFQVLANSVELETTTLIATGVAGYSIMYGEGGNLDVVAGARLWSVDNELSFNGQAGQPLAGLSFDDEATWVDPVVGVKGRANLSPRFYFTGWAMVGGFGVGSDFMWDVMGGLGYEFTETFSTVLGYRAMSVDYSNDDFVFDVTQQGPILGAVFRF